MRVLLILFLICLTSCGPRSLDDYRREGREAVRSLTAELKGVQTRQDLIQAGPNLKSKYNHMVDVMIAAREYYESHPEATIPELSEEDQQYSQELRLEIERVQKIEGADKLIAKYREEALNRLHLFENRLEKKKLSHS